MAGDERTRRRVVVVGGGFGGLAVAKALAEMPVEITLVDRTNHHLFQPLLYQVAMAGLSPASIASPIRGVLRKQRNVTVLLGEATGVDYDAPALQLCDATIPFDYLVLAAGAVTNYFGHPEWAEHALGLKDLDEATEIRRRVLLAFEAAERESDAERRRALLTFVVIGGGPTGVELAGALAELSSFALARDFRRIDPAGARIILLEGGSRVLAAFPDSLSQAASAQLEKLGVDVRLGRRVTAVDKTGVTVGDERIDASTTIWAAGVAGTPLAASLGVPLDRAGRVNVERDCSLPGRPNVFAIGDMMHLEQDGEPLPGVAQVALQQGQFVAKTIMRDIWLERDERAFSYFDKGSMATIGRSAAVAVVGKLRLRGLVAWLAWLLVHLIYLIGFRNRFIVLFNWAYSYFTYQRGARLITRGRPGQPLPHFPDGAKRAPEKGRTRE